MLLTQLVDFALNCYTLKLTISYKLLTIANGS